MDRVFLTEEGEKKNEKKNYVKLEEEKIVQKKKSSVDLLFVLSLLLYIW